MSAIEELSRLAEDETLLYRDIKTQYDGYDIKKVTIWSTNDEFLFAILYDLFEGHIFGVNTLVELLLLVEEDQVSNVEKVYCNFIISGLPKFKDLKISSCLEDMKNSDYLILHLEANWGTSENRKTRIDVIKDQFASLRIWGMKINKCLTDKCQILLIGDCLSPARLVIGLYTPDFPHCNIHGVTRHYERAAASILANKLKLPMREVKGVGVFGEDIVESNNSWIEVNNQDLEDEFYAESVMYHKPEIYEIMKNNEEMGGDLITNLKRPLKTFMKEKKPSKDPSDPKIQVETISKKGNPHGDMTKHERLCYPPLGIPELPEDSPGSYINGWQRFALDRKWMTETAQGLHDLPDEWSNSTKMYCLLNKKQPVTGLQWVVGRLDDQKFHCYTLPKKCKTEQSGYSLARGISDYLVFLLKKSNTLKRTSALVCSSGSYCVPSGMYFSFPVVIENLKLHIINDYRVSETTFMRINELVKNLEKEYDLIIQLFSDFPPLYDEPEKDSTERYEGEEDLFEEIGQYAFMPEEECPTEKSHQI